MRALQYIYTSWKNGESTQKGFMVYSKSDGISDAECTAIRDAMQYKAPRNLPFAPSQEEIEDLFPYSFAYFTLPGGRCAVAQSTYLGRDYSGRYGNYIIHALVIEKSDLTCRPAQLFGEPYIKTFMTDEELEARPPVPPLAPLDITQVGDVINDEQILDFLSDKEEEFAYVLACIIEARKADIPFYINDTRENLVLWASAVTRILPLRLAAEFRFITYTGIYEKFLSARFKDEGLDFAFTGVWGDPDNFNYETESRNSRQICIDFEGGNMTQGIEVGTFESEIAGYSSIDLDAADEFGSFLERTSVSEFNQTIRDAYDFYRVIKDNKFEYTKEKLTEIIDFGTKYCDDNDNSDAAGRLVLQASEESWPLGWEEFNRLWRYSCTWAPFVSYTVYDLLIDLIFDSADKAAAPCDFIFEQLSVLRKTQPAEYKEFVRYLNTSDSVNTLLLYLDGHTNIYTNEFYLKWIFENYSFPAGLSDGQAISAVVRVLLKNVCKIPGSERAQTEILLSATSSGPVFESVLQMFLETFGSDKSRLDRLCDYFMQCSDKNKEALKKCERMLYEIPAALPLAVRISARQIENSNNPEEEFWNLYRLQIRYSLSEGGISAAPMVQACLNSLSGADLIRASVRMINELDAEVLEDRPVAKAVTDILEESSVKILLKLKRETLQKAYLARADAGIEHSEKLCAMTVAMLVKEKNEGYGRPLSMSENVAQADVSLAYFEKADYELYVKTFFEEYMDIVISAKDVSVFVNIFFNRNYFSVFTGEMVSALKKMKKKNPGRWSKTVSWICIYAIDSEHSPAADIIYETMAKHLKGADEDEIFNIEGEILSAGVSQSKSDRFFYEVSRKESIGGRISGVFRKK